MDIILHLGAHRTGMGAFHAFLRGNRGALAELKLALWEPGGLRSGLGAGLTRPLEPPNPAVQARVRRSLGRIGMEVARLEQRGVDRLLFCEPGLIGDLRDTLAAQLLYPQLLPRLARLSGTIAPRCSRVVLVIRSYDAFWASALAQALPGGMPFPGAAMLAQLVAQPRRWRHLIVELASVFPRAECLILPHEALAGQLDLQLAMALAEPVPPLCGGRQRLHPRPTRAMLRQVLHDRRENRDLIPDGPDPWQMFDPDQVAAMQAHYAGDLDWLHQGADGLARVMADSGTEGYTEGYSVGYSAGGARDGTNGDTRGDTGRESGDDGRGGNRRGFAAADMG